MPEKRIVEIRAGEGGADAKLFAGELADAYRRLAESQGWSCRTSAASPAEGGGYHTIALEVRGNGASALDGEAGGHRVQRVPPTEKKDKIHTSTVTVAVMDPDAHRPGADELDPDDIEIQWFSGTGPGGQNRNKSQNCCRVRHRPTGLVRSAQSKSREANLRDAKAALRQDLASWAETEASNERNDVRARQIGSGMRADKKRTYRFQDGIVVDHETGRKTPAKRVMKGRFDKLWVCPVD